MVIKCKEVEENGKRPKIFEDCDETWLERSVGMFIFLRNFLGDDD